MHRPDRSALTGKFFSTRPDDVLEQVVLVGVAVVALVYQPRPPSGMTTISGYPRVYRSTHDLRDQVVWSSDRPCRR